MEGVSSRGPKVNGLHRTCCVYLRVLLLVVLCGPCCCFVFVCCLFVCAGSTVCVLVVTSPSAPRWCFVFLGQDVVGVMPVVKHSAPVLLGEVNETIGYAQRHFAEQRLPEAYETAFEAMLVASAIAGQAHPTVATCQR